MILVGWIRMDQGCWDFEIFLFFLLKVVICKCKSNEKNNTIDTKFNLRFSIISYKSNHNKFIQINSKH